MKSTIVEGKAPSILTVMAVASLLSVGFVSAGGAPTDPAEAEGVESGSEAEGVDLSNTLKWATASEVDNFGYDVFRSDSEGGPFEKINPEMIPGGGTTDEISRYQYEDSDIDPFTAYWYFVESISMGGVRERFTPIKRVSPKREPEEAEPDEQQVLDS